MRRSLMAAAVAGVVALAGAVLVPGTAHAASNVTCEGGFLNPTSGSFTNVLVPSNANGENFCFLKDSSVSGNVTVKAGGAILMANSSVAKNVTSSSAGTAFGGNGVTFSFAMCGSTIGFDGGHLVVTRARSLVEIGTDDPTPGSNPPPTCVTSAHPITNFLEGSTNSITHNRGGVEVESNDVLGNLTVSYNRGSLLDSNRDPDAVPNQSIAVNNNTDSTHTLKCLGNAGVVDSHNNTFQSVVGQCNP